MLLVYPGRTGSADSLLPEVGGGLPLPVETCGAHFLFCHYVLSRVELDLVLKGLSHDN